MGGLVGWLVGLLDARLRRWDLLGEDAAGGEGLEEDAWRVMLSDDLRWGTGGFSTSLFVLSCWDMIFCHLRCVWNFSGCSIIVSIDLWSCIEKASKQASKQERKKERK